MSLQQRFYSAVPGLKSTFLNNSINFCRNHQLHLELKTEPANLQETYLQLLNKNIPFFVR